MPKANRPEEDEQLSRERLIVPEEIFAAEQAEDGAEDATEETSDAEIAQEDEPEVEKSPADTFEQLAFFADEVAESTELKSDGSSDGDAEKEARDEDGYDPRNPRLVDKVFDIVELIVFTLATVFLLTAFIFRHAVVDGDSMLTTLEDGEHLIISDLFYTPKAGDIVVFEDYTLPDKLQKPIVKRVIATEGDTVHIRADGAVFVNGQRIKDEHAVYEGGIPFNDPTQIYAVGKDYTVPEDHIFVLGDNRNNSTDSRVFGAVHEDTVLGKVIIRIFPIENFGKV